MMINMINTQELIEKLQDLTQNDIVWTKETYKTAVSGIRDLFHSYTYRYIRTIFGLPYRFISEYRGSDGDHDDYYWIFSLDNKYFMMSGSYSSEGGTECYHGPIEVVEKEVTIKEWVPA